MKKIISITIVLAMLLSFAACGPKTTKNTETDTPAAAVESFLKSCKEGDIEALTDGLENIDKDTIEQFEEYSDMYFGKLAWTIGDTKENGDTATVKATITNVNMQTVFTSFITAAFSQALAGNEMSDEDIEKMMRDIVNDTDETLTTDVEVTVNKIDGKWTVDTEDETFINAVFGGLLDAAESLGNSFAQ